VPLQRRRRRRLLLLLLLERRCVLSASTFWCAAALQAQHLHQPWLKMTRVGVLLWTPCDGYLLRWLRRRRLRVEALLRTTLATARKATRAGVGSGGRTYWSWWRQLALDATGFTS
jgi:hypothetical protein